MTPERWAELRDLLEPAMSVPAATRRAYLQTHAATPELFQEAEQLLGFESDASGIFSLDRWEKFAESVPGEDELAGRVVGSYKLIEEVGRGGMGAVYRAERADGEYDQEVALKVLQEGLFTPSLVERFRAERQILARLSHPGIARLLDGGVTQDGRPYLVLEYVDGLPIDRYCSEHGLDVEARLRLFLKVAEAVQAAHQQLILHLDIKPANILVTRDGDPRLLDFGIARFLAEAEGGSQRGEATLRLLTPRYASPEQAAGTVLGVASDVFSLATLLYRLLTSVLPYPIEDAAPLEAARMILELPPRLPSDAAPALRAELKGDLDTILMQALRKEPERRYANVAAFAADIERHLASLPVLAHADSVRYRADKFLRRNWIAVTATAAVTAALALSVAAVVHSAVVARRERVTAERRLQDVRSLAHSYIFELIPELEFIPGTVKVRAEVVKRALGYLEAMSKEQSTDADMERELGSGYYVMGRLQGSSYNKSLGDRAAAWDSLNRGLAIQRRLVAQNPANGKDRAQLISTMTLMAGMMTSQGDIEASTAMYREAWNLAQPLIDVPGASPRLLQVANVAWYLGMNFSAEGLWHFADPEQGLMWAERSDALLRRFAAGTPGGENDQRYIGQMAMVKALEADSLLMMNRLDDAFARYDNVLPMVDAISSPDNVYSVGMSRLMHNHYARILIRRGEVAEATRVSAILRPSEHTEMTEAGKDFSSKFDLADTTEWTATIDWRNGRKALARKEMRSSLAGFRALVHGEPDLMWPRVQLMYSLLEFAELPGMPAEEATPMFREASAIATEYATAHPQALGARLDLARAHLGMAKVAHRSGDRASTEIEAQAASAALQPVLAARPGLPVAIEMLASTSQLHLARP